MNFTFKLTIGFYLITVSTLAQKIELNIHGKKLSDFIKIEKALGNKEYESKTNYVSLNGLAQPLIYKHKEEDLPDLLCYYFYFQTDSTIDYISYEWDEVNFKQHDEYAEKSSNEINAFKGKYNELYTQISNTYGESKNISKHDNGESTKFERDDFWNPNDSTEIELYIILSSRNEKKGMLIITPTYRISLDIRNKNEKPDNLSFKKPDEKKINKLDSTFKDFLSELKNKNMNQAKMYFSGLIIGSVTNQQLEELTQTIKFDNEIVIYYNGIQFGFDGSKYYMLQYKYKLDTNNPPKDLIKVIFDEKNKILGVQPTKLQ